MNWDWAGGGSAAMYSCKTTSQGFFLVPRMGIGPVHLTEHLSGAEWNPTGIQSPRVIPALLVVVFFKPQHPSHQIRNRLISPRFRAIATESFFYNLGPASRRLGWLVQCALAFDS